MTPAATGLAGERRTPDLAGIRGATTRFAPAPTGYLHLGHVANAIHVWGIAARVAAAVLLRIEDHDRERSRPEYDLALQEDLAWLGFVVNDAPVRQSARDDRYRAALDRLRALGRIYACDCSRSTFTTHQATTGAPWTGPGCPGRCRERRVAVGHDVTLRAVLGDGDEAWPDGLAGPCRGTVAAAGDLPVRDRRGNWTYPFTVVVDDLEQGVDLVIRGRDLLEATPPQLRLAALLGRPTAATFAHHPLVLKAPGIKLSKGDRDTSIRDLRAAGETAEMLIGRAAAAVGLIPTPVPMAARDVERLFGG